MQHKGSVFYDFDFSIKRPLYSIRQLFRDLKCCLERIRKGYCVKDLWEIDTWFLRIMPDMLEDFVRSNHSYPHGYFDHSLQKHEKELQVSREAFLASGFAKYPELYKKIDREASENWKSTLQEMANLMRKAEELHSYYGDAHLPYQKTALDMFLAHFNDLWD